MQNYQNHRQWYVPHHFIFYPLVAAGMGLCFYYSWSEHSIAWAVSGSLFFAAGWLSYMLRQHYALGLQNRLILLELRVRYMENGRNFDELMKQLSIGQLLALRFASDEEFSELTDKAISAKLSPDDIKKAIRNWKGDYLRV